MMLVDTPDNLRLSFLRHAEVCRLEPGHRPSTLVDHQHIQQNFARSDAKRGSFLRRGRGGLPRPDPNRCRRSLWRLSRRSLRRRSLRGLRCLAVGKEDDGARSTTNDGKQAQETKCGTRRHEGPPDWKEYTRELYEHRRKQQRHGFARELPIKLSPHFSPAAERRNRSAGLLTGSTEGLPALRIFVGP